MHLAYHCPYLNVFSHARENDMHFRYILSSHWMWLSFGLQPPPRRSTVITQFVVITIGTKWRGFTTWICHTIFSARARLIKNLNYSWLWMEFIVGAVDAKTMCLWNPFTEWSHECQSTRSASSERYTQLLRLSSQKARKITIEHGGDVCCVKNVRQYFHSVVVFQPNAIHNVQIVRWRSTVAGNEICVRLLLVNRLNFSRISIVSSKD